MNDYTAAHSYLWTKIATDPEVGETPIAPVTSGPIEWSLVKKGGSLHLRTRILETTLTHLELLDLETTASDLLEAMEDSMAVLYGDLERILLSLPVVPRALDQMRSDQGRVQTILNSAADFPRKD
jgi:hypothetical protein